MAHIHEVIDSDKCFTIDPITRAIVNDAGNKKTQLIQNDHNSERFAFQLPRYIEGHDMSLSNKVEVHYINLDQSSNERSVGVYEVTDLALSEDNESVLLSWLISNNATKYVGVLSFAICFKCMSDDVIDYSWNTAINSSIQIAKGMYNSEIIIKDYIDVLEVWKEEFMSSIGLSGGCLRAVDPIGTGSFSMNRAEGTDVGTNSVTLGTGCIASGQGCYAEGLYTIAGNYERLYVNTTTSVQIDSKNMMCLSIQFDEEVFPISVGDSIIIMIATIDITTHNIDVKFTTSAVQSITEPDPLAEIKEYKIYIDENEMLNSETNFETTQVGMILYKNQNQSSGGVSPMSNTGCHAEGYMTIASGNSSHAEGYNTTASGESSHAEGYNATASGSHSHAEGYITLAGSYAHAEGHYTKASGESSHAEGYDTTASGSHSHAEGSNTTASWYYSHAEGRGTTASGESSHAEGYDTTASGSHSHAEGHSTTASGESSHTEGHNTDASGSYAHAEGYNATASGEHAHAEGSNTTASWYYSHAEGRGTTASGESSHAEGSVTTASGTYSHAEGHNATASGYASHAEGYYSLSGGYTKFDAALSSETVDSTINYYIDVANLDTTLISTNDEIYVLVEDNASKEKQICKIIASSITEYNTTDEVSTVKHKIYFDENELRNQMSGFPNIKIINIHVKNNNNPYSTHAEGKYTTASGDSSHAEGYSTTASGQYSHAEGYSTTASGNRSHAEGSSTTASGYASHAEGYKTTASGEDSHAEGCYTEASGDNSHAEGVHTTAVGDRSHAEGYYTTASGNSSHAEGYYTEASSTYSHAEGYYTTASGNYSHAEGGDTTASGNRSHAEGEGTTASGDNSHAEGYYTDATATGAHAEGRDTTASGYASHAEGKDTTASGKYAHAEGYYNLSGGYTKFDAALGSETVDSTINYYIDVANLDTTLISTNDEIYVLVEDNASKEKQICKIIASSITEYNTTDEVSTVKHKIYFDENELSNQMSGFPNIKIINIHVKNNNNPYSTHAEGKYTMASGDSSHAEGHLTEASGSSSHAEGVCTMASGDYGSHAEGEYATASGPVSHAEGYYTTASGDSSHAEGDHTTASGEDSHAEGKSTTASGYASHAEGEYTKASGKYAHAEGYHTTARSNNQHVQGKYNVEDTTSTYAHIVGGGTSNTDRKNIHTLDWNGNAVYSGDVNATDSDGSTVSLLDTKWKLKGNVVNNNTISLPDNYTELKVMTFKTDQEHPIAYTQTILKDMIDVINKDTMQLYCGNTQQYGASWSINKSAKTIQLTNIENTTNVNNYATYLYYR